VRWREARAGGGQGAQSGRTGDSAQACTRGGVDGSVSRLAGWFDLWVQVMDQLVHHPMYIYIHMYMTIPQIFTRVRGPLAASAHEVGTAQVRILIGCVFVEIVTESEICHICRAVLLTI
jgi:hypothetical protein